MSPKRVSSNSMRARLYGGRASRRYHFAGARRERHVGARHATVLLLMGAAAAAIAVVLASHAGSVGSLLSSSKSPASSAAPGKPLARTRVRSLPPQRVGNGTEPLLVTLNGHPAPGTERPRISPAVAGSWSSSGDAEVFKSAATLAPCATYTLTVPKSTTAKGHTEVGLRRSETLHVACPSTRGLQQALARLGYLPDSLHAAPGAKPFRGHMDARAAAHLIYTPIHGTLQANIAQAPPLQYGVFDNMTKGALMVFQEDHHLQADGVAGPRTWQKLLAALAHKYRNPQPYTFVTVTETLPETLEVHQGSHVVLSSPTNTGVPGAETEPGVFPIFERFTSTTMVGTNPDGSKYSDPGVPWVNYFNGGDAVHGFIRPGYGYPQSNGCVELPIETAHRVFDMLRLGDIVQVY